MSPRDPAAKLTDFRTSHGYARTHWRWENGDGSLNVHRDPGNPRVKDNRLWDYEMQILFFYYFLFFEIQILNKQTYKQTDQNSLSLI